MLVFELEAKTSKEKDECTSGQAPSLIEARKKVEASTDTETLASVKRDENKSHGVGKGTNKEQVNNDNGLVGGPPEASS